MIRIHVSKEQRERFSLPLQILARKSEITVTWGDSPAEQAINMGFSSGTMPEKLNRAACVTAWEGGYLIEGTELFFEISELLGVVSLLENGLVPECGVKEAVFNRYYQSFDDCSFGFSRCADGFDLELQILEMARMGLESIDINRLYEDVPQQVKERVNYEDKYQWWDIYSAALDMYYESPLTRGAYDPGMLEKNRQTMLETARIARAFGMKLMFSTFEPRAWPERLFQRYPDLRGPRVDYAVYSCEPEYAPDVNHPWVRRHYESMAEQLLRDVPDLDMIESWAQDSAAGYPWAEGLYPGANGPIRGRKFPVWVGVNNFLTAIKRGVRKVSDKTRIHMNLSWGFPRWEEAREVYRNLDADIKPTIAAYDMWWLKEEGCTDFQLLQEGLGTQWKRYAPLLGFPYPGNLYRNLCKFESEVDNLVMRGGITPDYFVPHCINNEVIREFKTKGARLDIADLLRRFAESWTENEREAKLLLRAWELCDRIDASRGSKAFWTTSTFVSSRTLFRHMVSPIVPDPSRLTYAEGRYYKPYTFWCLATDPAWHDITYFGFERRTSDEQLEETVRYMDSELLPLLQECADLLKGETNPTLVDIRERVECFLHISSTERDQMDVQLQIHRYKENPDEALRRIIRADMERDIENTEKFIALLQNAKNVLIPVTSGEETTYMFKAPLWPTLQEKVRVMKKHFEDIPGPHFFEDKYYLGDEL